MSKFTEIFKSLIDKNGKTQVELSRVLNITPQAFSYYANGREPAYDLLIKIAEYFDVSIDYLLGESEFPNFEKEALKSNPHKNINDLVKLLNIIPDFEELIKSSHFRESIKYLSIIDSFLKYAEEEKNKVRK